MNARIHAALQKAIDLLSEARHAVALTGAGVSTPSGIPDFRSPDSGLWQAVDPFEVASLASFQDRPERFYTWIRPLIELNLNARPNPAHLALRDLERFGPLKAIITQNIDLLHTRAGSENVLEVHGHMREMVCLRCGTATEAAPYLLEFAGSGRLPLCPVCSAVLKPRVILLGELLPYHVMRRAQAAAIASDVLLVAGSSLEVYPVNELPLLAQETGSRLIVVNLTPTPLDDVADIVIPGDVTDVLPRLVEPFQPKPL